MDQKEDNKARAEPIFVLKYGGYGMRNVVQAAVRLTGPDGGVELPIGEYSQSNLKEFGLIENSTYSSIEVAKGYQAVLYVDDHFRGKSTVLGEGLHGKIEVANEVFSLKFGSIRIIQPIFLSPEERDHHEIERAIDGWWPESLENMESRMAWWREARFGCFIHWGLYSLSGGRWKGSKSVGYAEHLMRMKKISQQEYQEIFIDEFNPLKFNAESWVQSIKAAGMRYLVITAKHHDGFALYPSDAYPYDIRMTPFNRDPLLELKEACAKHDIKYGFYYSHAFDWEHPDAPGNDWEYSNPGGDLRLYEGEGKLWFTEHPELVPRVADNYVDHKSIPQIIELINKYEPDILWFDTPHKLPLSENLRILEAIRKADNRIVVNGRLAVGQGYDTFADYVNTGDRAHEIIPCEGDWETIPTTNESYGYSIDDNSHKPVSELIQLLVKAAARGGNVLMNLGPKGDGAIDERDMVILQEIGIWLDTHGESIYGTTATPLEVQQWGESTRKENMLYLHVFDWPEDGKLVLGGLMNHIHKAWVLSDKSQQSLATRRLNYCDWIIDLPISTPTNSSSCTVIAVEVAGEPRVCSGRLIGEKGINVLRSFDAIVSGGMGYGDGKKGNEYIDNWTSMSQRVTWKIRAYHSMRVKVILKYKALDDMGGVVQVELGEKMYQERIETGTDYTTVEQEFRILAGKQDLSIVAAQIDGTELMRLYSATIIPLEVYEDGIRETFERDLTDVGE
ncbi:alpha-L-fucosidase [Paenibacillus sp. D2_2]|uniref:alpha-L-fucosidase n=1 Tax=Paenibacillus sp. D2_2 TaxID=3073092 RepID=UPI0028162C92|nr:alpha-L-fucosidase [Paenibacillus sp. D2_2]WMT39073.1 alpha-L-fucosidase [Paenibacillus sp. D2_2]